MRRAANSARASLFMIGRYHDASSTFTYWEGRCKATWKREYKLPWREAGPPNHHDDRVDVFMVGRYYDASSTFTCTASKFEFLFFFITLKPRVE